MLKKMKRTNWVIYCMLMPWIIGFLVFKVYPIIISFYYSLLEYPILGDPEFVGLQNYLEIFTKTIRLLRVSLQQSNMC